MNRFATAAATAVLAGTCIATAPYTIAHAGTVTAPHRTRVSCARQVTVIDRAQNGTAGASQLSAAGLPELARAARAAVTLAGARYYGVALEASSAAISLGRGHCAGGPAAFPWWLEWGGTSDRDHGQPCVVVWGDNGTSHRNGTSAEVCAGRTAYAS